MIECLNKKVLKVIGSEMRKKESIHSNVMMEIYLMQTLLKECDTKHFKIPGYVQLFSMNPFIVHSYTELGISILVYYLQTKSPVSLYLDATGGVVSKIPEQPKRVLHLFFQGMLEMLHLFLSAKCSPTIIQYHISHSGSCNLHCICLNTLK